GGGGGGRGGGGGGAGGVGGRAGLHQRNDAGRHAHRHHPARTSSIPPQPHAVAFTARRYPDSERPARCAQAGQLRTLERRRKEMSSGIYRRGKSSWRIRGEVPGGGKRPRIEQTVRGTRRDADPEKPK